jgi:hypothetical protein
MKPLLVTALVELGAELVSSWAEKRRREREIERLDRERQARERALLRKRTQDRIRLAKLKYWAQREADERFRRDLEGLYDRIRWEIDANPYDEAPIDTP